MSAEGFFGPGEQSLVDMIQMWGLNKISGILTIKSGREAGEIHFDGGRAVWAAVGPHLQNEDAIYHVLALDSGKFRFVNTVNVQSDPSWSASYQEIIMEGMRRLDHVNDDKRALEEKFGFIPHIINKDFGSSASDADRVFLGLIDGKSNLEKVFNHCGLGLHKGIEVFNRLLSENIIALRKVRVLVVDDQSVWRRVISNMLGKESYFEVVGTAEDGVEALKKLAELRPDVMTLDLEMPNLDGIKTLYWMMSGGYDILLQSQFNIEIEETYRCPVVVISAVATKMADETLEALMGGACGYITKPSQIINENLDSQQHRIAKTVLMASQVDLIKSRRIKPKEIVKDKSFFRESTKKLVSIGASVMGGLTSLMQLIPNLPPLIDAAFIVVVDDLDSMAHARSFAEFLDSHSEVKVMTAERNTILKRGVVYLSPGNQNVVFGVVDTKQVGFRVFQRSEQEELQPIDAMLLNAMHCKGLHKRWGVVLAGDGTDGKVGFLEMVKFGETVFAQDSYSSLNPIKPENVTNTGISRVVPLGEMVKQISDEVGRAEG